ncbi:hypothetical protein BON22_1523 [Cyberlindnera fabianii]|uniref:Uncharacterized protein n=1 Tax=Cyberlindnera fabianii TaxID=36022 RepID=A0A1V2LDT1_CYBFA|nr:hypothetical protein BON22_1523 [Cyberlindnera fabianii]
MVLSSPLRHQTSVMSRHESPLRFRRTFRRLVRGGPVDTYHGEDKQSTPSAIDISNEDTLDHRRNQEITEANKDILVTTGELDTLLEDINHTSPYTTNINDQQIIEDVQSGTELSITGDKQGNESEDSQLITASEEARLQELMVLLDEVDEDDEQLEATTNVSETPSEKANYEVTRRNTLGNQSIRVSSNQTSSINSAPKRGNPSTNEEIEQMISKVRKTMASKPVMFYMPDRNGQQQKPTRYKWRLWITESVERAFPQHIAELSRFKSSFHLSKWYKYAACSDFETLKENMEFLTELLESQESSEPHITHLFKKDFCPGGKSSIQMKNSYSLFIPVTRSEVLILLYSITNIIANENDYVFDQMLFDIEDLRKEIIGVTFIKESEHITLNIRICLSRKRKPASHLHQDEMQRLFQMCQLLYDVSGGELIQAIVTSLFSDNRRRPPAEYLFF